MDKWRRTYARSRSAHALPSNSPHHLSQRSTLLLFWEVLLVRNCVLKALIGAAACLVATATWAADITWNGSVSPNPADGANWNGGIAPTAADTAIIGSSPQSPDFNSQSINWGKVNLFFANNIGDTGGGGLLNLVGPDNSQFFSAGDNHQSTVAVDIVATKNVQTNGTHSVTFNGDVTAAKVEAFGGSVATFNGKVTQTDEFMSIGGGGSKIVINNEFYWNNNNHGINNNPTVELGAGAKFFRPNGSGGFPTPPPRLQYFPPAPPPSPPNTLGFAGGEAQLGPHAPAH